MTHSDPVVTLDVPTLADFPDPAGVTPDGVSPDGASQVEDHLAGIRDVRMVR